MQLPQMKFRLPEWRPVDFAKLETSKKKIAKLLEKTGKGSDKFITACRCIMDFAVKGRADLIPGAIKTPVDVRALTYMFGRQDFRNRTHITEEMLASLYNPRPKLSLISLFQMINAFFLYFDQIGSPQVFDSVCWLLRHELENQSKGKPGQDIATLFRNKELLFTLKGPQHIVDYATNRETDLDSVFIEFCLQGYHDTRFQKICRYRYYIETLRKLPVGKKHSVLTEVCKPDVYNAPAGEGRLLGHEILSILIDRSSSQEISDEWRGVILTIAGDPRVPNSSSRFQKWWSILGIDRQKKVRAWLSGFDLRLFLEALKVYGVSSGNSDLQRMFKARKIFLEGLLEQKLIQHARLFVGNSPERYLLTNYKKDELPEYAKVNDTYRSMIYLQIGHCHMIEGSHNFKIWLFPNLPTDADIRDYSIRRFQPGDLSTTLEKQYWREFGKSAKAPISMVHHQNLWWQSAAIRFLQGEGINLNIEDLMDRNSYREYKSRYGL